MTNHREWTLQLRREMAIERFKKMDKDQRAWFSQLFGYIDDFTVDEARSACLLMDKLLKGKRNETHSIRDEGTARMGIPAVHV